MTDKLIIFDTTLRDGEQSPGASMTKDEKVRIAKALERMKVDVIEAGFPIASIGDFESVQAVAEAVKDSTVCGLARALEKDIDRAGEALKHANSARIHTFIATSPIPSGSSTQNTGCAKTVTAPGRSGTVFHDFLPRRYFGPQRYGH